MHIQGSCYCGKVAFKAISHTPYPYVRCYCSICRKTAGGGGYAVNIMAEADTFNVEGKAALVVHQATIEDPEQPGAAKASSGRRYFCRYCGSALWVQDPRWPQWVYPFASAIDTPLPTPPEYAHIMLDFAVPWVELPSGVSHKHYARYPDEAIIDWHKRHGLYRKE